MYTLYSYGTPNGIKPTILLEELQLEYIIKPVDITQGEQLAAEFLKISPNNKIPVLFDQHYNFYLFESVAILQYLAEKHHGFLPQGLQDKYQVIQWCYFQAAHIGPMFGQLGHFMRASEQIPYAIKRYRDECMRLMAVLDKQLQQHAYVCGEQYTIADMAIWPWIYGYQFFYQQTIDARCYPHLIKWYHHISERPAVKACLRVYEQ
ncbi:MAG: glutathione S-transferase family protein [Legionella sp.]